MCGIFGIVVDGRTRIPPARFVAAVKTLAALSATRGRDAAGLALFTPERILVAKRNLPMARLLGGAEWRELLAVVRGLALSGGWIDRPVALIGHSRMTTNGSEELHVNNQPIVRDGLAAIHNGIIVNSGEIRRAFPQIAWETESDSETIPALLRCFVEDGAGETGALRRLYGEIVGVASIAVLSAVSGRLLLATNNGSLYMAVNPEEHTVVFASERSMLLRLAARHPRFAGHAPHHLAAGTAAVIDVMDFRMERFSLAGGQPVPADPPASPVERPIHDISRFRTEKTAGPVLFVPGYDGLEKTWEEDRRRIDRLRRCSRCLLPETFPYITFDEEGVCSVCRRHRRIEYKGADALRRLLLPARSNGGAPDLILPLSGGRDSTYALHYVKTVLGMNPAAYTYDWGMVTDLARRNISRVTAALGVEHILVSADIRRKRDHIRRNVAAWLKRPRLGTLPLLMAGDKQLFHYGNLLRRQMNIPLILYGMNPLERTDFKVAFAGIEERRKQARHYSLAAHHKWGLLLYYGREFLANPAFLNRSLVDTLGAYLAYYFIPHEYPIFFEYIPWDEETVQRTIVSAYGWETAPDTPTTWRIGDGTAPFYNYIYLHLAGFCENDTFRSNQIRQGLIGREKALRMVQEENRPRFAAMEWYCRTIGLDFIRTLRAIDALPRLYGGEA